MILYYIYYIIYSILYHITLYYYILYYNILLLYYYYNINITLSSVFRILIEIMNLRKIHSLNSYFKDK